MRNIPFYICDVFCTNEKYSGNQLAVFIDDDTISSIEMQKIAFEMGFSETTFVSDVANPDGSYNVRIFTPKSEIAFAGHPMLGTAYIVQNYIQSATSVNTILKPPVGNIPITESNASFWMQQKQPEFGKMYEPEIMAKLCGINPQQINVNFPVEEVSTGLPFTIVPLKSPEALACAKLNMVEFEKFEGIARAKGIMLFCAGSHAAGQHICSRVFVPHLGIPEDPATGSATGCLGAYLVKHGYFGTASVNIKIGQGYEMGRPSELLLKADIHNGQYHIHVGGSVDLVARGMWE